MGNSQRATLSTEKNISAIQPEKRTRNLKFINALNLMFTWELLVLQLWFSVSGVFSCIGQEFFYMKVYRSLHH